MATRSYRQDSRSSSRSRGASPSGSSRAQRGGAPMVLHRAYREGDSLPFFCCLLLLL